MRLPRNWFHPGPLLTLSSLAVVGAVLVLFLWSRERVTRQNFGKIRVGMSMAELHQVLGPPDYRVVQSGLVNGPESYSTNSFLSEEERRQRGFRDYQHLQWTSSDLTIVAISDAEGLVVCRYTGPGQKTDWIAFLQYWLTRWF